MFVLKENDYMQFQAIEIETILYKKFNLLIICFIGKHNIIKIKTNIKLKNYKIV